MNPGLIEGRGGILLGKAIQSDDNNPLAMKKALVTRNRLVCLLVRRTSAHHCLVLFALLTCLPPPAPAAPAGLDPTFGTGGKVTTEFGGNDLTYSVAIQPDGKIVVAGSAGIGANEDFAVARYNADGSLDTTFNGTGKLTTDLGGEHDIANGVSIQSDGKIVVAGYSGFGLGFDEELVWAVVRYNANGTLDTTFNGTGKVMTDFGPRGRANCVALQTDGKILAAGFYHEEFPNGGYNINFALARYHADGSLDTTFNGTGKVITGIDNTLNGALGVTVQDDGKIVVAGSSTSPHPSSLNIAIVRYTSTGALDTSFNGTGKVRNDRNGADYARSVALQSNGRIIIAGRYDGGLAEGDFAVVRYRSDGSLDGDFNFTGFAQYADFGGDDEARSVAVQSDGKIITAGVGPSDFALARYTSAGALDTSFNQTGRVSTDFAGNIDRAHSMVLQSNGRIVVAGYSFNGSNNDFALARYEGDLLPPPEINVTSNGLTIPDGDTTPRVADQTDFGSVSIHGGFSVHFFIIENTGASPLTLYSPTVAITGPHAADFAVTTFPPNTLLPGASTTFSVRFDPSAVGLRQATILIASTDSDESSYEFAVQGLGVVFPGELDPTFDEDGKVTTDFGSSDIGASVAVQSDDKIVVAVAGASEFVLARYTSAGVLDTSFNGTGKVTTNPGGVVSTSQGLALQSDGRIVVAGSASNGSNFDFAVVRYLSTGALDTTFNGTGFVLTPIGSGRDEAYAVALQNDGKIVVAGYTTGTANENFAIVRFTSSGALDTSFNGTGIRTLNINGDDVARAVAIQTDGSIVVVGYADPRPIGPNNPPARFALARFTSAGVLDGTVSTPIGNEDFANSVAIQCDGRIIVAGSTSTENGGDIALVRYHPNLTLDTSFGGTGIVTTDVLGQFTDDAAYGVAVQADGNIVVGGTSYYDFALLRYTSNGGEDFAFGPARTNITTIGSGTSTTHSIDIAYGLAIQSDGKIVLAGVAEIPSAAYSDLALVRYVNNTPRQFFDNLAAAAGLSGAAAQPTATPFGDGVPNLLKYAFQMNLAGPDVHVLPSGGNSGLPIAQLVGIGGQTFYQVEFIRRKGSGLIYTPQKSTTLAPGSFGAMTGAITVQNLGAECERVIVLEPVDLTTTPNFFTRLQVTLP